MVTKQDCISARYGDHFRYLQGTYSRSKELKKVRVSGKCQTWKTRPDDFKLPVKYGMYESLYITPENASLFVTEQEYQSRKEQAQAVGSVLSIEDEGHALGSVDRMDTPPLKNPRGKKLSQEEMLERVSIPSIYRSLSKKEQKRVMAMNYENRMRHLEKLTTMRKNPSDILSGKSIKTQYFGPGNMRGARIKASVIDGNRIQASITVPYSHQKNEYEEHIFAAEKMRDKMGWTGDLVGVGTQKGYVFGFKRFSTRQRGMVKNPTLRAIRKRTANPPSRAPFVPEKGGRHIHVQQQRGAMWFTLAVAPHTQQGRVMAEQWARQYHMRHRTSKLRLFV
jgi:hypothetical protein